MTYIEFFDDDAVVNVCACLAHAPKRVVILGDKMKRMQSHAKRYRELFAQRGQQIEFVCRSINRNNLQSIVDALTQIVERYPDGAFGLTGGEDLCLVAMGIVSERFRDRNVQMHRFNIQSGSIIDCDQDGNVLAYLERPQLTVAENIRIYGGDVVYDTEVPGGTHLWRWDEEFTRDFAALWRLCCREGRAWNSRIGVLAAADMLSETKDTPLTVTAQLRTLKNHLRYTDKKFASVEALLQQLYEAGLLTQYCCDQQTLTLTFKNKQIRKCLTNAGVVLELVICWAAKQATHDGQPVYGDVLSGVCIDWDGSVRQAGAETRNEIDVMMMHGLVPVFVSCKNGDVQIDELYKLNTVAHRFGGQYAKKVLVTTALKQLPNASYIRTRAADMGIRLVENIWKKDEQQLQKIVQNLWRN